MGFAQETFAQPCTIFLINNCSHSLWFSQCCFAELISWYVVWCSRAAHAAILPPAAAAQCRAKPCVPRVGLRLGLRMLPAGLPDPLDPPHTHTYTHAHAHLPPSSGTMPSPHMFEPSQGDRSVNNVTHTNPASSISRACFETQSRGISIPNRPHGMERYPRGFRWETSLKLMQDACGGGAWLGNNSSRLMQNSGRFVMKTLCQRRAGRNYVESHFLSWHIKWI